VAPIQAAGQIGHSVEILLRFYAKRLKAETRSPDARSWLLGSKKTDDLPRTFAHADDRAVLWRMMMLVCAYSCAIGAINAAGIIEEASLSGLGHGRFEAARSA
jgi:hypothetical protein